MAKRSLADEVHDILVSRAPGEVTCIRRERSEGRSKHARIKAMHVEEKRIKFRITEPGEAHEINVMSNNAKETVNAVYASVAARRGVAFETVGLP